MRVHHGLDWWWRDGSCSECGSISPEEAARLLRTPGTPYASCDWTYGWPDRFEIGHGSFYAVHLLSLDESELEEMRRLTAQTLGVVYLRDDSGLDYSAIARGVRAQGVVGGKPQFPKNWP